MSTEDKLLLLEGHGGGQVMVRESEVSMAWDMNDANSGKFCNVLMKNSGQARIVGTTKELWKKVSNPLKVAGETNGLEHGTTHST